MFKIDYNKEAKVCHSILKRLGKGDGLLLDVGCGTGGHMVSFKKQGYIVEGLDVNKEMITLAQRKLPEEMFYKKKMQKMKLGKEFDVISLLNRTILFVKNKNQLKKTLEKVHDHLVTGGVLIMDLDLHEGNFDPDKSDTHYFRGKQIEGSVVEEYDLRDDKILWSVNLSIKDGNEIIRAVDDQNYLLIDVKKLLKLLREVGFKTSVYSMNGRPTKNRAKGLILAGVKLKRRRD